jgi:hypothetical protein
MIIGWCWIPAADGPRMDLTSILERADPRFRRSDGSLGGTVRHSLWIKSPEVQTERVPMWALSNVVRIVGPLSAPVRCHLRGSGACSA